MDVTPELLTEYKFKEEWRGYNRDEVDDFLERLAAALGELQSRYEQAARRAEDAERHPQESGSEEQLRRTLILAQRTADAVLEEARAEAAQLLNEAEERAHLFVTEAEERASALEAEVAERTRVELGSLATRRHELSQEVEALDAFVAEHRGRLQAELREQLNWLARPGRLQLPPSPPLSPLPEVMHRPEQPEQPVDEYAYAEPQEYEPQPAVTAYSEPTEAVAYPETNNDYYEWDVVPQEWQRELEAERADLDTPVVADNDPTGEVRAVELYGNGGYAPNGSGNGNGNGGYAPNGNGNGNGYDGSGRDADAYPSEGAYRYADEALEAPVADEPDTAQPSADVLGGIEDDPFLAELRRAVTDPEPLGPREADPSGWDTGAVSEEHFPAADLFGRKRRR